MNIWDILLGLTILAAMVGALKLMGHTKGCGGNCSECRHPCHAHSGNR